MKKYNRTFVVEASEDGKRWYMKCYNHAHLIQEIWSIHAKRAEAEEALRQANRGEHQIQIDAREADEHEA
jgi:hypothetical protein